MNFWSAVFDIFVVLFFVGLNGFFVAAEFAIVKVRVTQIEPLAHKGHLRAKIAKDIISHLDAYLSATQLGITMASLALGWIGEPFVATMIGPILFKMGITNLQIVEAVSFAVAFSIITFLHIILGELAPKSLAIQKADKTTLLIAYPLRLFFLLFKPVIFSLNSLANGILRIFGFQPVTESELLHSEEELRLILAQDKRVSVASKTIVLNAMDFRRKQARLVMIPRKEIVAISYLAPLKESLEVMRTNKFSRYPVYKESLDNVVGIVHTKDIFKQERQLKKDFSIDSVLRDAPFMPETVSLEKVLETMLQKKIHMIMLADEYGGTAGLLTLENVLEELVGNIQDEHDKEPPEVTKVSEDEYLVDASISTNDVERLLNQELSSKDILSIGAFVIEKLGHIPRAGESLHVNGTEFTVEKVSNLVVDTIRIKKLPSAATSHEETS
ncbi:MAG: HlyC/CorC family transporter [Ignavibacteriales bacterium]|nr:HlyC/CorC family transporter [Ignavibacteriales bacterium]